MRLQHLRVCRPWSIGLTVLLVAACGSYDAHLIPPTSEHPKKDSGTGMVTAVRPDGAPIAADAGDASMQVVQPMMGSGGQGGGAGSTGGAAGATGGSGTCTVNPDSSRTDCPMICPEQCNGEDDDCDGTIDEDVDNACELVHATSACVRGHCAIVQCDSGYRDCDHDATSGCEIAPGDVANCGGCGVRCSFSHAMAACVNDACAPAGCDALYADCDQNPSDCETLVNTLASCGACGKTCSDGDVANAIASCSSGACGVGQCRSGYGDCNGAGSDGCEQALLTTSHCGGCGVPCDFVGSVDDCSSGACLAQSCEPGYDDCNGNPGDGCESLDQPSHCGACNKTCDATLANTAGAACNAGVCELTCTSGFGDCDADPSTGCETPLDSMQRCGACDRACVIVNAASSCSSGTCALVRCKPGFGDCNNDPSDGCETSLDQNDHCGACTTSCVAGSATPLCAGGTCSAKSCPQGSADCDRDGVTCETDLTTTTTNCGACGNACAFTSSSPHASGLSCAASQCVPACDALYGDCNGNYADGCEARLDTLTSCGGCGVGCSIANATASCSGGSCHVGQCATDYADCDSDGKSCETKLGTTASCTGCGLACALPNAVASCTGSAGSHSCAISSCAQAYYSDCNAMPADGCEIDTRADTANCGSCGNDCSKLAHVSGASCIDAACSFGCQSGFGNCNSMAGCETPLNTNTDCGGCGVSCLRANATASCSTGSCTLSSCNSGFKDCDGNAANGCEPLTTLTNCGDCGVACSIVNGTASCSTGSCAVASCNSGWADCNANAMDGCERNVNPPAMGGLGPCTPDSNCVHQTYNGQDYYFCTGARSWSDARAHCQQQLLGDLAHPNDSAENSFLQSHLTTDSWLGGTDSASEGVWRWSDDNTQFWMGSNTGSAVGGAYTHWSSNQPGGGTGQNCADIAASGGTWDDVGCTATHGFVCEVQLDLCPTDPNKIKPGQCGCGTADTDTDGDGTADCNDGCPSDNKKTAPGACGCGTADTDTDGDGTPDCHDACPSDKNKIAAGTCGCGVPDVDSDGDGLLNCVDPCPTNASNPPGCFPYTPSNVDITSQSFATSTSWSCTNNATTVIDSSNASLTGDNCGGTATLDATNNVAQLGSGGSTVMVVRMTGLTVSGNHVLKLKGDKPIVLLVNGNVVVDTGGKIDASATGITAGPGGSLASQCTGQTGGAGKSATSGSDDSDGAGGGGFGTAGGKGGGGNGRNAGGTAGTASSSATLVPLRGGCSGGNGGDSTRGSTLKGFGGAGGGAFQISASGTIVVGTGSNSAILSAAGGGGQGNDNNNDCIGDGGGGGGSGGGILLEASSPPTVGSGGKLRVHGGAGGGGTECGSSNSGGDGHTADDTAASGGTGDGGNGGNGGRCSGASCASASAAGSNGSNSGLGGGGGGGGGGRVVVH